MKKIYLLQGYDNHKKYILGLFSTLKKAETFLKKFPKKHSYIIIELPIDKVCCPDYKVGDKLGNFVHHHWGKIDEEQFQWPS